MYIYIIAYDIIAFRIVFRISWYFRVDSLCDYDCILELLEELDWKISIWFKYNVVGKSIGDDHHLYRPEKNPEGTRRFKNNRADLYNGEYILLGYTRVDRKPPFQYPIQSTWNSFHLDFILSGRVQLEQGTFCGVLRRSIFPYPLIIVLFFLSQNYPMFMDSIGMQINVYCSMDNRFAGCSWAIVLGIISKCRVIFGTGKQNAGIDPTV